MILVFAVGKKTMASGKSSAVTFLCVLYVSHKISVHPAHILFKLLFSRLIERTELIIHYRCSQLLRTYLLRASFLHLFVSSDFLSLSPLLLSVSFLFPSFLLSMSLSAIQDIGLLIIINIKLIIRLYPHDTEMPVLKKGQSRHFSKI